jgi:hypothetical protein
MSDAIDDGSMLLGSARRAVEIAIEENEASAEKWLREVNANVG